MATNIRTLPREKPTNIERLMHDLSRADEMRDEHMQKLQRQIALYERIYGLTSQEMVAELASGQLVENFDICEWLMNLDLLAHVTSSR